MSRVTKMYMLIKGAEPLA
uniref:Uncharacterized protein n=1 Tax=Anguilla anguilla TaxID=7936 RepID=A0A0E9UK73_ANGAN